MTASEFVSAAFLQATGKLPTFSSGDSKWQRLLAIGNFFIDEWSNEPGVDWHSLYSPAFNNGLITATDTFALDEDIKRIDHQQGNKVRIQHTDNTYTEYNLVPAVRFQDYQHGAYCTQVGRDLVFNEAFTAASLQFGGTLLIPAHLYPTKLVDDTDPVPVDDPNWLVFVTAADFVRNDVTRKDLRADLINQANKVMARMREDNNAQINDMYRPWSPTQFTDPEW